MTTGKLVSQCRTHHLDKYVLEQAECRENKHIDNKQSKFRHDELIYIKKTV